MGFGNRWNDEEDDLMRKYYGKVKIDEVVSIFPRHTKGSIHKRAAKLKLKGNPSIAYKIYTINRNYFKGGSLVSNYWAGFIAADGNIGKDRSVSITLASKDKCHLEKYIKDVGYNGPIHDGISKRENGEPKPYSRVDIWGVPEWHDALREKYNITPVKSLTLEPPPNLTFEESLAFIAGFIDGNGCIRWQNGSFTLSIVSTKKVLLWISEIFDILVDKRKQKPAKVILVNNHPSITFYGKRAISICQILKKIPSLPLLDRKWNKIPCKELKNSIFYLCGPIDRSPDNGTSWRREITPLLQKIGVSILDPTCNLLEGIPSKKHRKNLKENGMFEEFGKIMRQIRNIDLDMVKQSDSLIVNLKMDEQPFGTIHEIVLAHKLRKNIYVFSDEGKRMAPDWLFSLVPHDNIFNSIIELIHHLES